MKIITTENNKEVVYVQTMDLRFLLSTDDYIPLSIESRLANNLVNNNSRFIWTKFTDEAAVNFFKQATFILDYSELCNYSILDLSGQIHAISQCIDEIIGNYCNLPGTEQEENEIIRDKFDKLIYKRLCLMMIVNPIYFRDFSLEINGISYKLNVHK